MIDVHHNTGSFHDFLVGSVGEICQHRWKERLEISKAAKFQSSFSLKANKDIALQSHGILRT